MRKLRRDKELTLRPIHPNAGMEAELRRRLTRMVDAMNRSVQYWLKASYRANEPKIAQDDALPSSSLRAAIRELAQRWERNFDELAPKLAEYFSRSVVNRSDAALKKMLRDAGFTVKFQMTPAMRDVLNATINQQVSLIKSIPAQYFTQVEGIVMRSVTTGRDLATLTKDLQDQFGVTRRRAVFIARDQTNKAFATMNRARQTELGISEAVWVHSAAGRHPRPTHVAMNGKRYDVTKGMWDPAVGKFILPGELPNCRCISRSVIPGFS